MQVVQLARCFLKNMKSEPFGYEVPLPITATDYGVLYAV
jgi:hypothetical protein